MTFNYSLLERLSEIESSISKKTSSATELYDVLRVCIEEILSYMAAEFNGKKFTYDMLSVVFIGNGSGNSSRMNLYCLMSYLEQLLKQIKSEHIHRYTTVIRNILPELEQGILLYETSYKQLSVKREPHYGRRTTISSLDFLFAMRELFFIENAPDISSITLRDIKPNVMFIIRQMLELKWKRVLGYSCIVDSANNGAPIPKFSQAAWNFIKMNQSQTDKGWSITLPLTVASLDHLNNWSNSFVHNSFIYGDHIQFLAIEIIHELMMPATDYVTIFQNTPTPQKALKYLCGNVRINGYNKLKEDFESYIKDKMQHAAVCWLPATEIEAYIETI